MPESHSETTTKYVAVKTRIEPIHGAPSSLKLTAGLADIPISLVSEMAPWLSRSEQEELLRALETGWAIIEDEWAGTKRFEGGDFNHVGNAVRLLRERLAQP